MPIDDDVARLAESWQSSGYRRVLRALRQRAMGEGDNSEHGTAGEHGRQKTKSRAGRSKP